MGKICFSCKEEKELIEFDKRKAGGYRNYCYDCKKTLRRKEHLASKYGISLEDFQFILDKQEEACALCGRKRQLCVDHCHKTGQIRGLLCHKCNTSLGGLGDNKEGLERALQYLTNSFYSLDEYFINQTKLEAKKSKDPSTKVGAVIVKNGRIIGRGYNGFPIGVKDTKERWERPLKYSYVVHAELNSIVFSQENPKEGIIYCNYFPCSGCAKYIIQAGIKEVVSAKPENLEMISRWKDDMEISRVMFQESGILTREI